MFELSNYKDVDGNVMNLVSQYYALRDSGNLVDADKLLEDNADLLKPYHINANSFNKIELGIWELAKQLFYHQKFIFSQTEPPSTDLVEGTEWLQEY